MVTDMENVVAALESWHRKQLKEYKAGPTSHFNDEILARLASDKGLAEASKDELEHLDECPICLANWSAWRRAWSTVDDLDNPEEEIDDHHSLEHTYGFLEAAASDHIGNRGVSMESSCGSFRLELLPDREQPSRGMIILTALKENREGHVCVRDRQGREILSGTLSDGRLARLCQKFNKLDISIWTVGHK